MSAKIRASSIDKRFGRISEVRSFDSKARAEAYSLHQSEAGFVGVVSAGLELISVHVAGVEVTVENILAHKEE